MNLSTLIEHLQSVLKEHGDIPTVYTQEGYEITGTHLIQTKAQADVFSKLNWSMDVDVPALIIQDAG